MRANSLGSWKRIWLLYQTTSPAQITLYRRETIDQSSYRKERVLNWNFFKNNSNFPSLLFLLFFPSFSKMPLMNGLFRPNYRGVTWVSEVYLASHEYTFVKTYRRCFPASRVAFFIIIFSVDPHGRHRVLMTPQEVLLGKDLLVYPEVRAVNYTLQSSWLWAAVFIIQLKIILSYIEK
jgi:hypothetical protein